MIELHADELSQHLHLLTIRMVRFKPNGVIEGYRLDTNTPITIKASQAVYRTYRQDFRMTVSRAKAREITVLFWDETVLDVELHPILDNLSQEFLSKLSEEELKNVSEPRLSRNLNRFLKGGYIQGKDWLFDGVHLYTPSNQDVLVLDDTLTISKVHALNLMTFHRKWVSTFGEEFMVSRDVIKYVPAPGVEVFSPAITVDEKKINPFRLKDGALLHGGAFVNLRFALQAAKLIGSLYGPDEVRIFNIRKLMVEMNRVNLNSLDASVLKLNPAGMTVKTALAFLMRYIYMEDDLERLKKIRTLFVNNFIQGGITFESVLKRIHKKGASGLPKEVLATDDISKQLAELSRDYDLEPESGVSDDVLEFIEEVIPEVA